MPYRSSRGSAFVPFFGAGGAGVPYLLSPYFSGMDRGVQRLPVECPMTLRFVFTLLLIGHEHVVFCLSPSVPPSRVYI